MDTCPLPVDWLDYLEGAAETRLAEHLANCPSCQSLVRSLRVDNPDVPSIDWALQFRGRLDAVWHEDRPEQPAFAEFWFSAASFAQDDFSYESVDRILTLVVSHPTKNHGSTWLDVVPVRSDVEDATETDFLIRENENNLGAPWRVLFAYQCKVDRRQLDTRVGRLEGPAVTALMQALKGWGEAARWGIPLQGPDDPRLWLESDFDDAIKRLRTPWLLLLDRRESQPGDKDPHVGVAADVGQEQKQSLAGEVHWLRPVKLAQSKSSPTLAAASQREEHEKLWELETEVVRIRGRLEFDWDVGKLAFHILAVHAEKPRRVRLYLRAQTTEGQCLLGSELFEPKQGLRMPLADGVFEDDVTDLGAEVIR